jgi:hypothetical protein
VTGVRSELDACIAVGTDASGAERPTLNKAGGKSRNRLHPSRTWLGRLVAARREVVDQRGVGASLAKDALDHHRRRARRHARVGYLGGAAFEDEAVKGVLLGLGLALSVAGAAELLRHARRRIA